VHAASGRYDEAIRVDNRKTLAIDAKQESITNKLRIAYYNPSHSTERGTPELSQVRGQPAVELLGRRLMLGLLFFYRCTNYIPMQYSN